MIRTYTQTFNGSNPFNVQGDYFRLLSTVNPVDVFIGYNGQVVAEFGQVSAGLFLRLEQGKKFDLIRITTGAAEQVQFVAGSGQAGYDRLSANVTIASVSIDQGQTLNNDGQIACPIGETALTAINAARKFIRIKALSTNLGPVHLGAAGLSATAAPALTLAPDDEITITEGARAAWYAWSLNAGNYVNILTGV